MARRRRTTPVVPESTEQTIRRRLLVEQQRAMTDAVKHGDMEAAQHAMVRALKTADDVDECRKAES